MGAYWSRSWDGFGVMPSCRRELSLVFHQIGVDAYHHWKTENMEWGKCLTIVDKFTRRSVCALLVSVNSFPFENQTCENNSCIILFGENDLSMKTDEIHD